MRSIDVVKRPQAPGRLVGKSQGRPTRNILEHVRRQAAIEASLSLIVVVRLDSKQINRGGKERGYHKRVGKGGGGESGHSSRGKLGGG